MALDADGKSPFFKAVESVEWPKRDIMTATTSHGLPFFNHTQSWFNISQMQSTRARILGLGIMLSMVGLAMRHLTTDLRSGVLCPSIIFAKLFGGKQWGLVHGCRGDSECFTATCQKRS